jgi:membrane protease YdiL (CAAX protease family)
MQNNHDDFKNNITKEKIPIIQHILLWVILIGYPLLATVINRLSPPAEQSVDSRIIQIYLLALAIQLIIFLTVIIVITKNPGLNIAQDPSRYRGLASIGIKSGDFTILNVMIGAAFLFVAVIILNIISNIIEYYGVFQAEDITYLLPRTAIEKGFWITLSLAAGFTEEICFRGYIITRMAGLTGSAVPGVILGSISFGLGHLYQGWAGVLVISIYGCMFALLFLARGSLVPCIVAHALQDILAIFAL